VGAVAVAAVVLFASLAAGCGGGERGSAVPSEAAAPQSIELRSPAFRDGTSIPRQYTCDGAGTSLPLTWTGVPPRAAELVLVVQDPDAPGGTFVHWTLYGLRPDATGLRAGAVPSGARQGENSDGSDEWFAPCPPKDDDPHRYVIALYALKQPSGLNAGASLKDVRGALERDAMARGELIGRYRRTVKS
jgi:Raf kinase inhibitor-like YbhB/YbcL family protein